MKLIIGLGNPGVKYNLTRHNVGFLIIERIKKKYKLPEWRLEKKFKAEISKGEINDQKIIIAKPQTFMNSSGESVISLKKFYKIKLENIIIIHDDIDINLGKIKIQKKRSSAGHNGIKSIINSLGTNNFWRIRIGIKDEKKLEKITTDKYVLEQFNKNELTIIKETTKEIIKNPLYL